MNLLDFKINLDKINALKDNFSYELSKGLDDKDILEFEKDYKLQIPDQVKEFYSFCNGLKTVNPALHIYAMDDWVMVNSSKIILANFNKTNEVYFDRANLNAANQWSIKNSHSDYEITKSMSSFWSNKVWHWIKNGREIWNDKYWEV